MTTLDDRALNRARLHRQWLTEPRAATVSDAMEHLVGMQAQQGDPPYYQLWSRLRDFRIDDLSAALHDRVAVRVVLMRGTIHLVTARDALLLRPVVQPYLTQTIFNGSQSGRRLVGIDPDALVAEGRRLLAEAPLSADDLGAGLAERFPGFAGNDLAYGLRGLLPLIQVPPRGVWGLSGGLTYASTRQWLGAEPEPDPEAALDAAIPRYLAAYGPASIQDFQAWSGRTRAAAGFERLRDRLIVHHDRHGRQLFDLPELDLPDPDTAVVPTLLGAFDNILLSHQDRGFILGDVPVKRVITQNGLVNGTVLIDGFVGGTWKPTLKKKSARVDIAAFAPLTTTDRDHLESEARRLLDLVAPGVDDRTVAFAAA